MTSIFFCWSWRWSDFDKLSQTGAEWHVDCSDMVKLETRCKIPIWRTFGRIPWHVIPEPPATLQGAATGRIQWHVIPEPCITLQGAATWWIYCHDSRSTCHIAGCSHLAKSMSWSCHIASAILKIVFRHILFYFCFLMQFELLRAAAFVSFPICTCFVCWSVSLLVCSLVCRVLSLKRHI